MSCGICKACIIDGDFGIYICIKAISIKSNYTTLHYKHSYALFVVCSAVNFKDTSEHFRSFDSHNFTLNEIGDAPYNSLWPRDTIWRHGSRSTLAQVMACCLTAPSHYLNQCWLIISEVQWHSYKGYFTRDAATINDKNLFENYISKISFKFPRGQSLNDIEHMVKRMGLEESKTL